MKKRLFRLSEVCKLTGVTRRTLQEYDKIDLLHPTKKTEAGYWMYSNLAIQKITAIQVFVELGYERKRIKAILEMPDPDLKKEWQTAKEQLEEKKKKIEGMITTVDTLIVAFDLPEEIYEALADVDMNKLYQNRSFVSSFRDSVNAFSSFNEEDLKAAEDDEDFDFDEWVKISYYLWAIAANSDKDPTSKEVQVCVKIFYEAILNMFITADDDLSIEECMDAESVGEIIQIIEEDDEGIFKEYIANPMDAQLGEGSGAFIIKALKAYKESLE